VDPVAAQRAKQSGPACRNGRRALSVADNSGYRPVAGTRGSPLCGSVAPIADGSYVKQMVIGTLLGSRRRW
jgi:hypothetical protein